MIELYQKEDCPFCAKVRRKLDDLQLDWISRTSPKGSPQREFLLKIGGKEMVPFLVDQDHGTSMYESDDIIEYLEKTYG
ncbi:MAG: glutathione S-transferase N-terminal domain-containing protein [Parcubacteria group bacterium]|nr:glutathione S-transferase N-terminal domain-containing protein [Parcubacteria group bacterium]